MRHSLVGIRASISMSTVATVIRMATERDRPASRCIADDGMAGKDDEDPGPVTARVLDAVYAALDSHAMTCSVPDLAAWAEAEDAVGV